MAGTNSKWNGALLGSAFGALALYAIKMSENLVTPNIANTVYGWFTFGADKLIAQFPTVLNSTMQTGLAFTIAILIGALVGLYTEYK